MGTKLSFIEEAEAKGFAYCPSGILGNGFYGNGVYVSLSEMEKINKTSSLTPDQEADEDFKRIDAGYFIACENKSSYLTAEILRLFPDLKEHQLHNFLNRFQDVFLSQKLFTVVNRKRVFSNEAVKFIYDKLIKKDKPVPKKRGRRAVKSEDNPD